jgi:hypothetical protein
MTRRAIALLKVPAVKWGIGLALIAATLAFIDPAQVADQLRSVRWAIAAPAIVGLALVHMVNAFGWGLMTRLHTGLSMSPKRTALAYYASMSIGLLTPSNVGSDVYRVASVAGETGGWKRAAAPVAIQRITSFLTLGALGLAATAVIPVSPALRISVIAMMVVLTAGLISLTVLMRSGGARGGRLYRLLPELPGGLSGQPGQRRSQLTAGIITGLVFHIVSLWLALALLTSLTSDVHVPQALAALAITRLAILLPVSISGLGFQEAAAAVVFPAIGLPAEVGVAVAMLTRIGLLITVSMGAACMSISGRKPVQAAPVAEQPETAAPKAA